MRLEQQMADLEALKRDLEARRAGDELAATIAAHVSGTDTERSGILWRKADDRTLDSYTQSALRKLARSLNPFVSL